MSLTAPVNRILPYSVVDGPGNRCAIFFQSCNLHCAYCHNPETQRLCTDCGECVDGCPAGALSASGAGVAWDAGRCVNCDRCIKVCPHRASPKVRWMTPEDVLAKVSESVPFIRGISTSGGECGLYPAFLERLYGMVHEIGLTCLMDSNGTIDLSLYPGLMAVCDGVMLDVKAWDAGVFRGLTGGDVSVVKRNLSFLADEGKLEEIRIVTLDGYMDAERCVEGIAEVLGPELTRHQTLKLIRFRPFGVRGELERELPPTMERMRRLADMAASMGFEDIRII
ncbi:MAG: YjjW family glycine radical enzyme activase [Clostridia bacterium]|nr:YjjW family glycine radical enzyme activase [Clostridia bacterium]